MFEYTVQDTDLVVGADTVSFGAPIQQVIEYDEFIVIRLKMTGQSHPNAARNVIAVDADGSIRWKLPEQPPSAPRPYTRIFTKEDGDLWANNFSGHVHRVDLETGDIVDSKFVK